jgi:hypothetical protein
MMPKDMTAEALARRADEVKQRDSVTDYLGNGDLRDVTVFLEHDRYCRHGYPDYGDTYTLVGKEIIGVSLCNLDEPQAAVEALSRDEAVAMFGSKWVADLEEVE